jgi:prolyl-tRNA synthetase
MFIPTLRENPADAEFPSHQLLIRAGFVRQLTAGIYSLLPLGHRTMVKIAGIIREEMNSAGAQEFLLPALHPADLFGDEEQRWSDSGASVFRLRDHGGRNLRLAASYEDAFTEIARKEIRSYKDLPQIWYQIQPRFRDESRPKSGLLCLRQFLVKDSCSFDIDAEGLDESYRLCRDIYSRIFTRCGVRFVVAEASPGAADSHSEKFMVRTEAGEDFLVTCECGYAADLQWAGSNAPKLLDAPHDGPPAEVHTPGQKTIADIADFLKVPAEHQIKSLVYIVNGSPVLFLVRGDHQLNESKVIAATRDAAVRPADAEEIRDAFGADAGSLGPVGVQNLPIYADLALRGRHNLTCGANRNDYHVQGVTPDVHFKPIWADLRTVQEGESCTRCGRILEIHKSWVPWS